MKHFLLISLTILMLNGLLTYCGLYGTSYENDNEN